MKLQLSRRTVLVLIFSACFLQSTVLAKRGRIHARNHTPHVSRSRKPAQRPVRKPIVLIVQPRHDFDHRRKRPAQPPRRPNHPPKQPKRRAVPKPHQLGHQVDRLSDRLRKMHKKLKNLRNKEKMLQRSINQGNKSRQKFKHLQNLKKNKNRQQQQLHNIKQQIKSQSARYQRDAARYRQMMKRYEQNFRKRTKNFRQAQKNRLQRMMRLGTQLKHLDKAIDKLSKEAFKSESDFTKFLEIMAKTVQNQKDTNAMNKQVAKNQLFMMFRKAEHLIFEKIEEFKKSFDQQVQAKNEKSGQAKGQKGATVNQIFNYKYRSSPKMKKNIKNLIMCVNAYKQHFSKLGFELEENVAVDASKGPNPAKICSSVSPDAGFAKGGCFNLVFKDYAVLMRKVKDSLSPKIIGNFVQLEKEMAEASASFKKDVKEKCVENAELKKRNPECAKEIAEMFKEFKESGTSLEFEDFHRVKAGVEGMMDLDQWRAIADKCLQE